MGLIRNLLALIGLAVVAGLVFVAVKMGPSLKNVMEFDSQAPATYLEMAKRLVETGNGAEATIWKIPVEDGITTQEVEDAMGSVATELNIKNVGELPLYKEVEAKTGEPFRFLKIYMFCNALTAARMVDYSDAYSAYLPCRITLLEDKDGKLWLITLNMDLMIHGGTPLPPALKEEALEVKRIILEIMNRGAAGEF